MTDRLVRVVQAAQETTYVVAGVLVGLVVPGEERERGGPDFAGRRFVREAPYGGQCLGEAVGSPGRRSATAGS
ncbi:hypothetical protein [Streptomyces sp. NPDC056948]|uniref:hypothetical protein n=1 Tax=Streptomyces sp. NPDC056948 TaxID=3345975 RepID=UPI003630708B